MIRVAILGAGIGERHLAGYRENAGRFEVVTVCDLDPGRAYKIIGDAGIAIETDLERVLTDPSVDLVDICLPPGLHVPVSKAALEAAKDVICEKPIGASLEDVDDVLAVAAATGRQFFPVFQYRYGLAMTQFRALQRAGLVGKAFAASFETHWNRDAAYYAVDWRGTWAGENGGAILGHAIHTHDLLVALLGPVARLSAVTTTRVNSIEVDDCTAIVFEMESGAVATSSVTLGAGNDTTRIKICYDGITVESGHRPYAPMMDGWTFTARAPVRQEQIDAILAQLGSVKHGFGGYLEAVADVLETGVGDAVLGQDGRRSIEMVTAIYQASRSRDWVALPLDHHSTLYSGWVP